MINFDSNSRVRFHQSMPARANVKTTRHHCGLLTVSRNLNMKKITVLFLIALLSGCGSLPPKYSASPTRCLVQSATVVEPVKPLTFQHAMLGVFDPDDHTTVSRRRPSWSTHILIHSVDSGDILWVRPNSLGGKVWLEPGQHKISVICCTDYSWGTMSRGTDIDLEVKPGYTYSLAASQLKHMSDIPQVEVTKKAAK